MLERYLTPHAIRKLFPFGIGSVFAALLLMILHLVRDAWLESLIPEPLHFVGSKYGIAILLCVGLVIIVAELRSLKGAHPWITAERLWKHWKGPFTVGVLLFVATGALLLLWRIAEVRLLSVEVTTDRGGKASWIHRLFGHRTPVKLAESKDLLDQDGSLFFRCYPTVKGREVIGRDPYILLDVSNTSKKRMLVYLQTVDHVNYMTVDMFPHSGDKASQSGNISKWENNHWHSVVVTWTKPPEQTITLYLDGKVEGVSTLTDYPSNIPEQTRISLYQ